MRYAGLLAVLLTSLSLAAAPELPSTIRLSNGEWPPFTSAQLPHGGGLSRIVSEAFANEGFTVRYEWYPWKRALEIAKVVSVEGTAGWTLSPERQRDFLHSDPIAQVRVVFFKRSSFQFDWTGKEQLTRYKIGITHGYNYGDAYLDLLARQALKPEVDYTDEANLTSLAAGRLDLFLVTPEVGLYLANRLNLHGLDYAKTPLTAGSSVHLLVSRRHPQARSLLEHFNRGLAKLKVAGKIDAYLQEASITPTHADPPKVGSEPTVKTP